MIKRILLVGIIIATLFGIYVKVKKPVKHFLRVKQIERDILSFLNEKDDKHISDKGKTIYKYINSIRKEDCDVSVMIEHYLNIMDEVFYSKAFERNIKPIKFPKYDDFDFYKNRVEYGSNGTILKVDEFKEVQKSIKDVDIKNYSNNNFKFELSKKIENILEHKSNDINKDWYMNPNNNKIVELPYNCYLEYHAGSQINYDKTEEIYLNSKFIKCELEKSDVDFNFNDRGLDARIIYKSRDGSISDIWLVIGFKNMGSYIELTPNLRVQYVEQSGSGRPYVLLKSHDVDLKKERERWYAQQVTDVGRMIDEKISMDIVNRTEEIYKLNQGSNKTHNIISAIEYDFFGYVETGLSKEEANTKILANWYYDNERKVTATIDINKMLYLKGVNNKEILERVREFYNSDLPLEEIRDRIQNVYQDYHQYIKQGMSSYNACMEILNNWVYD